MKESSGKTKSKLVNDILKKELKKMNIHGIGTDIVNIKELKDFLIKIRISKRIFLPLLKLVHVKKERIR